MKAEEHQYTEYTQENVKGMQFLSFFQSRNCKLHFTCNKILYIFYLTTKLCYANARKQFLCCTNLAKIKN